MSYDSLYSSNTSSSREHLTTSRLTSPTCEDLGIPCNINSIYRRDSPSIASSLHESVKSASHSLLRSVGGEMLSSQPPMFNPVHGLSYSTEVMHDPFCTYNQIPLPSPYGAFECANEPAFIRKRNERERERVRCVNEGYARLRQHLPLDKRDKRISKVETLRSAISYIHHLQGMLNELDEADSNKATQTEKRKSSSRRSAASPPPKLRKISEQKTKNRSREVGDRKVMYGSLGDYHPLEK